jgi:hypothetical protein
MKNQALWKDLMTLRRKLSRCARIEAVRFPRRSVEGAKEVDRTAKAAGRAPSNVDWGFQKSKIGRPKNNGKNRHSFIPAAGQTPIIRSYKSDTATREIQLFKFEVWNDSQKMGSARESAKVLNWRGFLKTGGSAI